MHRLSRFGAAMVALAAVPGSLQAQESAEAERAFAVAARGFSDCLLEAAEERRDKAGDLASRCQLQETSFRQLSVRLRLTRGQSEQQALDEVEADVINGRRMAFGDHGHRYALAR